MFSKACEYGIRAIVHISLKSEKGMKVSLKEISHAINSPEAFTAKILQQLSKNDLIQSFKGPTGGFIMSPKQLKQVMLRDVVNTIDGDSIYTGCGLGLEHCDATNPCPLHNEFMEIREQLRSMLQSTSIRQLSDSLRQGEAILKR
ncbi:MAG: Rrf2 family transcriptional regulator [Bacteroidetes bacterium]|nr:Rrf2 family transcriptional regulator [Bacteroidota bacterium]MCB0841983.1 Rrf2 family transcriptional regulator [Bacteroidota bacterium]MCB0853675.1 Rrf2 family transcriptional regulator [Bacteroidota bacterium]